MGNRRCHFHLILVLIPNILTILACGTVLPTSPQPSNATASTVISEELPPTAPIGNINDSSKILPWGLVASQPIDGWISYQMFLSFHNTGNRSVAIYTSSNIASTEGFVAAILQSEASFVETREGNTYPAAFLGYDWMRGGTPDPSTVLPSSVIVPAKLVILGENNIVFFIKYKIPELLHPTRLVISPGLGYTASQASPIIVDLANVPPSLMTNSEILDKLPRTFQLSENVQGTLDPTFVGEVADKQLIVSADYVLKNSDITGDQSLLGLWTMYAIDELGFVYRGTVSGANCDEPGRSIIGPGQSIAGYICFRIPNYDQINLSKFYLAVIGPAVDNVFSIEIIAR